MSITTDAALKVNMITAKHGPVTACQVCASPRLRLILDLGLQPLAERMTQDAPKYPLRLVRCGECDLVQLDYIAPPFEVFPRNHPYASGNAKALHQHFEEMAEEFGPKLNPGDLMVDIGCNDGTLLSKFPAHAIRLGVEPTDQIQKLSGKGLVPYGGFFTASSVKDILSGRKKAKLVTATNVAAHVPDPHDFIEGVAQLLADDGLFVAENHDVSAVLNGQWDTVYHEHLRYYSEWTFADLLARHGLKVVSTKEIRTHGGSIRTVARKRDTAQAAVDIAAIKLENLLKDLWLRGHTVYGVGATTRASVVIHRAGITRELMPNVCEVSTSEKLSGYMPATDIKIIDERVLFGGNQPSHVLLFAWHLAEYIIPSLREKGFAGKVIIPLPEPRIIDAPV